MPDYTELPRHIADCMKRAGAELSEDQCTLLAGYLAQTQSELTAARDEAERLRQDNEHQRERRDAARDCIQKLTAEAKRLRGRVSAQSGKGFYGHIARYKGYAPQRDWTGRLNTCAHHGDDHEACAVYSGQVPCDVDSECLEASILLKQAEAVEQARDEICSRVGSPSWHSIELTDYAQRLRQQADDLNNV